MSGFHTAIRVVGFSFSVANLTTAIFLGIGTIGILGWVCASAFSAQALVEHLILTGRID